MKTILSIVQDPINSKSFVHYVASMARDMGGNVHLLNVQNPTVYPVGTPEAVGADMVAVRNRLDVNVKQCTETLKKISSEVAKELDNAVPISYTSEIGTFGGLVKDFLMHNKTQLITVEKNRADSWLAPSDYAEVLSETHFTTLVVPQHYKYNGMKEIVYATDYNEEDLPTLNMLTNLVGDLEPEITALHITDSRHFDEKVKKKGFTEMVQSEVNYKKLRFKVIQQDLSKKSLQEVLNEYSDLIHANMIVVLKENKPFLERIFTSSNTKQIVREADRPVLIFNETH